MAEEVVTTAEESQKPVAPVEGAAVADANRVFSFIMTPFEFALSSENRERIVKIERTSPNT
jgi:hypothetical protein